MIDFRYLLTTIVAIFLALAIGLLIGSSLLADELSQDLEKQVQEKIERNNELRDRITDLDRRIEADEDFEQQLIGQLVEGELTGDPIVLVRFEGTDGALIDTLREAISLADGSVATTITINNRMSLEDTAAVEDLLADLPRDLSDEENTAGAIGRELGAAATSESAGEQGGPSFQAVADPLIEHGFIDIETDREFAIPFGSDFVVAAGAEGEAPYDLSSFSEPLLTGLATGVAEVVAAEGWMSEWGFVTTLRDGDVRDRVATVDHGDTVAGSVSVVLELDRIPSNDPGHYGFRDGAEGIAPETLSSE